MKTAEKALGGEVPTNGAKSVIENGLPYTCEFTVVGVADLILHRWNPEGVDIKAAAQKGSKAKKTDDVESYVYRNNQNQICIPGEYFRQAIIHSAKYKQDPRSPRKSAMDLFKAGIVPLTILASLGKDKWDYDDKRRAVVQRNGVNRVRPAFKEGWTVKIAMMVNLPEYITPILLHEVLTQAGRVVGVGDFRPTYGRFIVTSWQVKEN